MKFKQLLLPALITVFIKTTTAQNFTIVDTLPDGAYGAAAWGDYNNDGLKDFVYMAQGVPADYTLVYTNTGSSFIPVAQYFPYLYNPAAKWVDLNNDGFDDLVMNGADSSFIFRTFIYQSNGNGTFTSIPNSITGLFSGSIAAADYNNDGWIDLAVTGNDTANGHAAYIYKNTGNFNFTDINATLIGTHFGELQWGDYDNDSLPDLVINGIGNSDFRVRIYKNMGNDIFQLQPFYMKGSGGTVDWADMDNDGWLDILVTGYDSTSVQSFTELHHNNGNNTFTIVPTNMPECGEPSAVAIADFNNDNLLDASFIGGINLPGFTTSYLGINTGNNWFQSYPMVNGYILMCITETSDYDNDGDMDLLFGRLILRNDGPLAVPGNQEPVIISINPNPVHEKLKITAAQPLTALTLLNSTGAVVNIFKDIKNTMKIDISNLAPGIYFLRYQTAQGQTGLKKIVISK